MSRYVYLGDKLTAPALKGMRCDPVRRADGKCVLSTRMATALVRDQSGVAHVVLRRRLRLAAPPPTSGSSATPAADDNALPEGR